VDVRVIAATNQNLEQLVVEGAFREDLFYRLSVFPIDVPPLRERREDLLHLARHFLEQTCTEFGREPLRLTRTQAAAIEAYDWPGNVRELKNVIERAVILSRGNSLRLDLSVPQGQNGLAPGMAATPAEADVYSEAQMRALQKRNLVAALEQAGWRVSGKNGAAELLGIKPTTLADRIKSFGIERPSAK
jgi:transcriptional regulator with GAF, ATPase, and Fis domain